MIWRFFATESFLCASDWMNSCKWLISLMLGGLGDFEVELPPMGGDLDKI